MNPEALIPIAIVAVVILFGGAIAVRLYLPKLILWNETRKLTGPELEQFRVKAELLENAEVVDLLARPADHQIPIDRAKEKKPHHQKPWLSPYPEAVKAANKRRKSERKGKNLTLTRKQIAAAASMVSVETIPDHLQPANSGAEHFWITVKLQGLTAQKIQSLTPQVTAQLGLHSLLPVDAPDFRSVRFEAHTVEPEDRLRNVRIGKEFFEEHPAETPSSLPLALTSSGAVWSLPTHHTLILGMTGSGKGSPLAGIVRQLTPFIEEGRVRLYGADPKASELKPYEESSLFARLTYDDPGMAALIEEVHDLMKQRAITKRVDLENADLGRSLAFTKETPLVVFVVDEFLSLLIQLQDMGKEGKRAITLLTAILAQGRSLGVLVVAATQEADKELLGRMRGNFANAIVLKQPSPYFNDLFLGEGAVADGYDSTRIAPANPANGYATAGIGFVKEATGLPVRVRFAYSSDRDIADLVLAHPKREGADEFEAFLPSDTNQEEWGFSDIPDSELPKEDQGDEPEELGLPPIEGL